MIYDCNCSGAGMFSITAELASALKTHVSLCSVGHDAKSSCQSRTCVRERWEPQTADNDD